MLPYIAEFIGTMLLILLGDGVVANVNLDRSGMKGAGAVQITFAWGLAVLVPAFIFGSSSGAHFNPALNDRTCGYWQFLLVYGARICDRSVCRSICRSSPCLCFICRAV